MKKNTYMYHYFTSACHRSWWYDPQFLIYRIFWVIFFAYLPPSKPKKSALFYTCAPKVTITWCMAPEIHNETERIFCYFAYFFPPLLLPLQPGKSKFWKNEKITWICHHFTRGPKITIIWCMLPEIWSATDRFCCHFGPALASLPQQQSRKLKFWKTEQNTWRYYNFPHVHHKLRSYDVWFQTYKAWPWISCHFGPFLHF